MSIPAGLENSKSRFRFPLVIFLAIIGAVCFLWGWLGSGRIVSPVRLRLSAVPSDLGLDWEPIPLKTSDGTALSAWFLPHPKPRGALLLLHGYGACKEDLLDIAVGLRRKTPFHLLMLDFRAQGASEGRRVSFGHREVGDVEAALNWFGRRPGCQDLPVGCLGVSMGGAVAILAALRFKTLQAVVVDSVYGDLAKTIARSQWLTYHIPRVPLGQIALWGTEFRLRCRLKNLSPARLVSGLAPKPLLIIHGLSDVGVPVVEAEAVYQAARQPKQIWRVAGAAHASCYYVASEEYTNRVAEFFQNAFL